MIEIWGGSFILAGVMMRPGAVPVRYVSVGGSRKRACEPSAFLRYTLVVIVSLPCEMRRQARYGQVWQRSILSPPLKFRSPCNIPSSL